MTNSNPMGNIYVGLQINKYTLPEAGTDKGDMDYVPRNDRPERITRVAFNLKDVVTWNEAVDEFYTYFDKRPKVIIEMRNGANDVILIENFNNFTFIMEAFGQSQENPFITFSKQ